MASIQVFSELLQPQRRPQGKPGKTVLGNEKHSSPTPHASVGKCKSTHFRFWGQLQIEGSPGKVTPSMCLAVFPHCYLFLCYLPRAMGGGEGAVDWWQGGWERRRIVMKSWGAGGAEGRKGAFVCRYNFVENALNQEEELPVLTLWSPAVCDLGQEVGFTRSQTESECWKSCQFYRLGFVAVFFFFFSFFYIGKLTSEQSIRGKWNVKIRIQVSGC